MALSLSLSELARLVDGNIVRGEAGSVFSSMAALDAAGLSDISFLGNEKYLPQFLATKAGAVIIPSGHDFPDGPTALVSVENPTLSFSKVVAHFAARAKSFEPGVHPTAFVSPFATFDPKKVGIRPGAIVMDGSVIGNGTEIGANSVIHENTTIGKDCRIGANATIREGSILGDRVFIQPGAVIGSDGYGYELADGRHVKIEQVGIVELADDVEIGANTTIDRARFGKTVVGKGTKIDNLVQIGHNVVIGEHCLVISQSGIAGSSKLGDYVTLAAQCGMVGHVSAGSNSIFTARAGITSNFEGGTIYAGNPALPIREDTKIRAMVRRLPKILDRVKALEKSLPPADPQ